MNFLKSYFKTHLKYWYLYLGTIFLMVYALDISLFVALGLHSETKNTQIVRLICAATFGLISSSLMWVPNNTFSKKVCSRGFSIKFLLTLIISQLISTLFFFLIGYALYFS